MATDDPPKKDLTSLVELSALEMAKHPNPEEGSEFSQLPTQEPVPNATDVDFGNLEIHSIDLPSASQIGISESPPSVPEPEALAPEPEPPALVEPPFLEAEPLVVEPPVAIAAHDIVVNERENPVLGEEFESTLDPARPAVHEPPAGSDHAKKSGEPAQQKQDLSAVKRFGEKIQIGQPVIDAAPAFSLMARNHSNHFDAKTIKAIEDVIGNEDYGLRIEDVRIQLEVGKLLVPQISEFAAIALAQKLRDVVDSIEIDLAAEIYKSSVVESNPADESVFVDFERFDTHREEVHDIASEPTRENDLFSSNMPTLVDYQITRVLSVVTSTSIVNAEIAENPASNEFEEAVEALTKDLMNRAFKLGAHGVLGIGFTLRSIDGYKDSAGKVRRAYRLLGSGTAVRARRKNK